ncbi:MAG: hypothetical protein HKN12_11700, partial [Gemmatimonadetes bacterium]|nr:hypothetical protein [Gemmatimonadota bacterium]
LRSTLVPVAHFGSMLSWPLIIGGMFLQMTNLTMLGILAFSAMVLFQIVTLPVEFDASARAKKQIRTLGIIQSEKESDGVAAVLNAAALTYVAAAVTAVMQLLYFLMRARR